MPRRLVAGLAATTLAVTSAIFSPLAAHAAPDPTTPTPTAPARSVGTIKLNSTQTPHLTQTSVTMPGAKGDKAARAFLGQRTSTYHIDNPSAQLRHEGQETVSASGIVADRYTQLHQGVPVFGGAFVVRSRATAQGAVVVGTSGTYYTGLSVATRPTLTREQARRAIVGTLALRGLRLTAAEEGSLTVIPTGPGELAYQWQLTATDVRTGSLLRLEALTDAHHGTIVSAWQSLEMAKPVETTGVTVTGDTVPLNVMQNDAGTYVLSDTTKPMFATSGGVIETYDAKGADYRDWLKDTAPSLSPAETSAVPVAGHLSDIGAVDAHYGLSAVYDYYYKHFGRNSIDGKGMPIKAVVNVTDKGRPFLNAFWDGREMVFGGNTATEFPYSAALDVIGHELTHGVTQSTANLVYFGESGAMNEAYSDYFGAAIEADVRHTPMSDPDVALIGEDLCRTGTPRQCAFRDLNDGSTIKQNFEGIINDHAGVHINAPVYSGALWNIREALGPELGDKLVYTTLTQYLTSTDDFLAGRAATLAAAKDLGLSAAQVKAVENAFTQVGITPGWQGTIGIDSRSLYTGIDYIVWGYNVASQPNVSRGRWVLNDIDDKLKNYEVYAGSLATPGQYARISPDDGWAHDMPDIDGQTMVWISVNATRTMGRVWKQDLVSGRRTLVHEGPEFISSVKVSGDRVAWSVLDLKSFNFKIFSKKGSGPEVQVPVEPGSWVSSLDLREDDVAWAQERTVGEAEIASIHLHNVVSGKHKVLAAPTKNGASGRVGQVMLTPLFAVYVTDDDRDGKQSIVRRTMGGWGDTITVLVDENRPDAPLFPSIAASDVAVTYLSLQGQGGYTNAKTPKLMQLTMTNPTAPAYRVSCNRGEESSFAMDETTGVVFVDATLARVDLVYRPRPAMKCR